MTDILYERIMPYGPSVRIRRTSAAGDQPVTAVVEVNRRAGTPRGEYGDSPPLLECEAMSEAAALAMLQPHANDDREMVELLHLKGLR